MLNQIATIIKDSLEDDYFDVNSLGGCKNMTALEIITKEYHQVGNPTVYDEVKYIVEIRRETDSE